MRNLLEGIATLGESIRARPIDTWENFYFTKVGDDVYRQAEAVATRISEISRGRKTRKLSANSEIVGKVGEYVVRGFAEHYFRGPWESFVEVVNPKGGDTTDLKLWGAAIDVKTRQLHSDATIAPNFDLRVPEHEIAKQQDIYLLAGYCPGSAYGYLFGWCTYEELQVKPLLTENIRFPAKCVPLVELHDIRDLECYCKRFSEARG